MRFRLAFLQLSAILIITGCNKKDAELPPLHPVNGVVTMNGKVPEKGSLSVRPETDNPNLIVSANLQPDGNFDLSTLLVKDGKKHQGAPVGTYRLTYSIASEDQAPSIEVKTPFTVEPGQNNHWKVELAEKK